MKRSHLRFIFLLMAFLLAPVLCEAADQNPEGHKDTIFVANVRVESALSALAKKNGYSAELEQIAASLSAQFVSALSDAVVFQLVERSHKEDIELEQAFAAVAVDPNDKNAAQAGKMAGAKYAFLPMIDGFEDTSEVVEHKKIGRSSLTHKVLLSVAVRIIDTTTGKLFPDTANAQMTKEEEIINSKSAKPSGSQKASIDLAKEMAQKLSQEIVAAVYPAKVLSIIGKQITLNRGSNAGFGEGDVVEIYAVQEIKDDDTGEILRSDAAVIGKGVVSRVEKRMSYATISEDLGITKGCVVKKIKGEKPSDTAKDYVSPGSSEKPVHWK